jgi:hypothetical protein
MRRTEGEAKMIHLSTILTALTRIDVALSNWDRAIRDLSERAGRRDRDRRSMNG